MAHRRAGEGYMAHRSDGENHDDDRSFCLKAFGFPGGSASKETACNAGHLGSIPGLERSPGEGNGKPLQYSCLEGSMDGGAWWASALGVPKSQTRLKD